MNEWNCHCHHQQWTQEEDIENCVHSGLVHNCKWFQISAKHQLRYEIGLTGQLNWNAAIKCQWGNVLMIRIWMQLSNRCNILIEDRIEHEIYLKYNQMKWINHWNLKKEIKNKIIAAQLNERSDNMLLRKRFIDTDMNAISHRFRILIEDRVVFN